MIAMLIGGMITVYVNQHKLGYVTGAGGGYILGEEPGDDLLPGFSLPLKDIFAA
jgi:ABC-type uncharacterized transport system substrate-binding protein